MRPWTFARATPKPLAAPPPPSAVPDRLAQFLNVSRARLMSWLAGEEAPPNQVFLDALDVIADGPYASPERRRPRVAVVPSDKT